VKHNLHVSGRISIFYRIEKAFCWTKLHFVAPNCILSDKKKIQTFSALKESLHRPIQAKLGHFSLRKLPFLGINT
jgi:hypothetical protein